MIKRIEIECIVYEHDFSDTEKVEKLWELIKDLPQPQQSNPDGLDYLRKAYPEQFKPQQENPTTCDYYICGKCFINSGTKKVFTTKCNGICKDYIPEPTPPQQEFCECKDPDFECAFCGKWMKSLPPQSEKGELNWSRDDYKGILKIVDKLNEVIQAFNSRKGKE